MARIGTWRRPLVAGMGVLSTTDQAGHARSGWSAAGAHAAWDSTADNGHGAIAVLE
jgi:hypothetical protein